VHLENSTYIMLCIIPISIRISCSRSRTGPHLSTDTLVFLSRPSHSMCYRDLYGLLFLLSINHSRNDIWWFQLSLWHNYPHTDYYWQCGRHLFLKLYGQKDREDLIDYGTHACMYIILFSCSPSNICTQNHKRS
jgi:hypothetical protein